jgi:hypothetical protein
MPEAAVAVTTVIQHHQLDPPVALAVAVKGVQTAMKPEKMEQPTPAVAVAVALTLMV